MIFFFPYNPSTPLPRQTPHPSHPEKLDFGPFRLRLAPFRLRLAPFRVCFRSVSGPFRGVGWGWGGVGERGFCKGKEYHYFCQAQKAENTDPRTNYAVVYATARGHLKSLVSVKCLPATLGPEMAAPVL